MANSGQSQNCTVFVGESCTKALVQHNAISMSCQSSSNQGGREDSSASASLGCGLPMVSNTWRPLQKGGNELVVSISKDSNLDLHIRCRRNM